MSAIKKTISGIFIIIILAIIAIVITYFVSFRPTVTTVPLDTPINIQQMNLVSRFLPNDVDLSLSGISATSNTEFSTTELTELAIYGLTQSPAIKQYVTGIKIETEGENLVVYVTAKYYNVPLQGKFIFKPYSQDGKGIFHYVSGKIGFISIPNNLLFDELTSNKIVQFDKTNANIIIHFTDIKQIIVQNLYVKNSNLDIEFKGKINFF